MNVGLHVPLGAHLLCRTSVCQTDGLAQRCLVTTAGRPELAQRAWTRRRIHPLHMSVTLCFRSGITQIRHLERQRTITLQVTPPFAIPLQEAMEIINTRVIAPMEKRGMLEGADIGQSGVADKLTEARRSFQWNFLL